MQFKKDPRQKYLKRLRLAVLHEPYCEKCKQTFELADLVAHHANYFKGIKETAEDLRLLCGTCHEDLHLRRLAGLLTPADHFLVTPMWDWVVHLNLELSCPVCLGYMVLFKHRYAKHAWQPSLFTGSKTVPLEVTAECWQCSAPECKGFRFSDLSAGTYVNIFKNYPKKERNFFNMEVH